MSTATKAKSVSGQTKLTLPEMLGVESVVSKSSCPPPELGNGSRSESTDEKMPSDSDFGGESVSVEGGCPSHVYESQLRACLLFDPGVAHAPAVFSSTVLDTSCFDLTLLDVNPRKGLPCPSLGLSSRFFVDVAPGVVPSTVDPLTLERDTFCLHVFPDSVVARNSEGFSQLPFLLARPFDCASFVFGHFGF